MPPTTPRVAPGKPWIISAASNTDALERQSTTSWLLRSNRRETYRPPDAFVGSRIGACALSAAYVSATTFTAPAAVSQRTASHSASTVSEAFSKRSKSASSGGVFARLFRRRGTRASRASGAAPSTGAVSPFRRSSELATAAISRPKRNDRESRRSVTLLLSTRAAAARIASRAPMNE